MSEMSRCPIRLTLLFEMYWVKHLVATREGCKMDLARIPSGLLTAGGNPIGGTSATPAHAAPTGPPAASLSAGVQGTDCPTPQILGRHDGSDSRRYGVA